MFSLELKTVKLGQHLYGRFWIKEFEERIIYIYIFKEESEELYINKQDEF